MKCQPFLKWEFLWVFWIRIMGLAGVELSFKEAFLVLCFAFVTFVPESKGWWCFGHCWTLFTRHQGCISNPIHRTGGWEWVTGWDRIQPRHLTQQKQYPIPCEVILAIKAKRKEEECHTWCYDICLLVHLLCVLGHCFLGIIWTSLVDWMYRIKPFVFLQGFHVRPLLFCY